MIIEHLTIDADLVEYLSKKKDVERFINFCIRERRETLEKDHRSRRAPSEDTLSANAVDSTLRHFPPESEVYNPRTPFMGKNVVITGTFDNFTNRNVLAEMLHAHGAAIKTGVTRKTDIVILGIGAGPSKREKIKEYLAEGLPIRLIYEEELIALVHEYHLGDCFDDF